MKKIHWTTSLAIEKKKRGIGLSFIYAIQYYWQMAFTIHVSAKISDYKNSAYSLTPLDSREWLLLEF